MTSGSSFLAQVIICANIDSLSEEYDTISGYIQDKLGKVAEVFDQVKENNFILKVTDVDNKRVERVRAIIIEQKEDKEEVRRENGRD